MCIRMKCPGQRLKHFEKCVWSIAYLPHFLMTDDCQGCHHASHRDAPHDQWQPWVRLLIPLHNLLQSQYPECTCPKVLQSSSMSERCGVMMVKHQVGWQFALCRARS